MGQNFSRSLAVLALAASVALFPIGLAAQANPADSNANRIALIRKVLAQNHELVAAQPSHRCAAETSRSIGGPRYLFEPIPLSTVVSTTRGACR